MTIISASFRTDLPAYYPRWLLNRFKAGYVVTENPYNRKPSRISLRPEDVSGVVLWTRNPRPFMKVGGFDWLTDRGIPWYVQMTHTGYHKELEPNGLDSADAMAAMRDIEVSFGAGRVNWRYDPIVFTDNYTYAWHMGNFDWLCRAVGRYSAEVTISYVELYRKAELKMQSMGIDFAGRQPDDEQRRTMTAALAGKADYYGLQLSVCSQNAAVAGKAVAATCTDANKLSAIAGRQIVAEKKGNRPDCGCAKSRDIGAYDTCLAACVYCYACRDFETPKQNRKGHDPEAESLLPLSGAATAKKHEQQPALPWLGVME